MAFFKPTERKIAGLSSRPIFTNGPARKRGRLAGAVAAITLAALVSGCWDAPIFHGIAFSPDGERMAYLDHDLKQIIMKDLRAGEFKTLYNSPEGFNVVALFWPEGEEGAIHVIEGAPCERRGKDLHESYGVYLKRVYPDTLKKEAVWKEKIPCLDNSDEISSLLDLNYSAEYAGDPIAYDPETLSLFAFGQVLPVRSPVSDEGGRSPFLALLPLFKDGFIFTAKISGDRKFLAYGQLEGAKTFAPRSNDAKGRLKILNLEKNEVVPVSGKWQMNTDYFSEGSPLFMEWTHDSSKLLYIDPEGYKHRLKQYDLPAKRASVVFDQSVGSFQFFPSDDRIFVHYDQSGVAVSAVLNAKGEVIDYVPSSLSFLSLTVDPTARHAASYLEGFDDIDPNSLENRAKFFPVPLNLKDRREETLVFRAEDQIAAGDLFCHNRQYDRAIEHYKEGRGMEALSRVYAALYWSRKNDEARTVYADLMTGLPEPGKDPHLELGDLLMKAGEWGLAQGEYRSTTDNFRALAEFKFVAKLLMADEGAPSCGRAWSFFDQKGILDQVEIPEEYDLDYGAVEKSMQSFREMGCYDGDRPGCPTANDLLEGIKFLERVNYYEGIHYWEETLEETKRLENLRKEGLAFLNYVLSDYPDFSERWGPFLHYNLGELYDAGGDCKNALNHYRTTANWRKTKILEWEDPRFEGYVESSKEKISRLKKTCKTK